MNILASPTVGTITKNSKQKDSTVTGSSRINGTSTDPIISGNLASGSSLPNDEVYKPQSPRSKHPPVVQNKIGKI